MQTPSPNLFYIGKVSLEIETYEQMYMTCYILVYFTYRLHITENNIQKFLDQNDIHYRKQLAIITLLPEKLIDSQFLKNFFCFMKLEGTVPCSPNSTASFYTGQNDPRSYPYPLFV